MIDSARPRGAWAFAVAWLSCAAACGPGATGTSDAGADAARVESGLDGAARTDAPMDAPAETTPQCPDLDDDGHGATPCGDDCDDNDPRVHPGMRETCDGEGRDEDCNPCTVGEVLPSGVGGDADQDEDGYPSNACFNVIAGESMPVCRSGTSDDAGLEPAARVVVDPARRETRGTDCSDRTRTRNPAVSERCDAEGLDEDCDGESNEGCECPTREHPELSRRCADSLGMPLAGVCGTGTQDCIDGRWGECSIGPSTETCDERDNDCDGRVDEGGDEIDGSLRSACFPDRDADGFGDRAAMPEFRCGGCDSGSSLDHTDCDDTPGAGRQINPTATELCDARLVDENCDGRVNGAEISCPCTVGTTQTCCLGQGRQTCEMVPGSTNTRLTECSMRASASEALCNRVDDDCDPATSDTACPPEKTCDFANTRCACRARCDAGSACTRCGGGAVPDGPVLGSRACDTERCTSVCNPRAVTGVQPTLMQNVPVRFTGWNFTRAYGSEASDGTWTFRGAPPSGQTAFTYTTSLPPGLYRFSVRVGRSTAGGAQLQVRSGGVTGPALGAQGSTTFYPGTSSTYVSLEANFQVTGGPFLCVPITLVLSSVPNVFSWPTYSADTVTLFERSS